MSLQKINAFFNNIVEHSGKSFLTFMCVMVVALFLIGCLAGLLAAFPFVIIPVVTIGVISRLIYAGLKGDKKNDYKFTKRYP